MNAPSGLTMMLKAMGIEFDPKMFKTMADAVIEIRDTLRRLDTNSVKYRKALETIARGTLNNSLSAQVYARQVLQGEVNPIEEIELSHVTNRS